MTRHPRPLDTHAIATALACCVAFATAPAVARAEGSWWSVGVLGGTTQFDRTLADFQWDASLSAGMGAQVLGGRGPLGLGVRAWRSTTTQSLGDAAATSPHVHATRIDALALARVGALAGVEVNALASAGRLHLGYAPDAVTFTPSGGGSPVNASFAPIDEWVAGAGAMLRAPLPGPWSAGLTLDRQFFSLDTAHRNGDVIEYQRRSFGDWNARFEIAWNHRSR